MGKENLLKRITVSPAVMVGKPTIRGMRITVEQVLNALANGLTTDQLLEDYPDLEKDDIQACLFYATELLDHERVYAIG
jgi:uncharacterized protein (DUF433 family)